MSPSLQLIAMALASIIIATIPCEAQTDRPSQPEAANASAPGTALSLQPGPLLALQSAASQPTPHAAPAQLRTTLLRVPPQVRLMVFAPHPDDEAIGAAGLIQRVIQKDGKAKVVFVTNGDGYLDGVRLQNNQATASSDDFIVYGVQRQREAQQAVASMGLEPEDAIFLGFPDGGIDDLWTDHWSSQKPYTSPHTQFDHAHYKSSFWRYVSYSGAGLHNQILRAILEFAPDWIVLPDPRDLHPDHSTTGVFVLEAIRKLRESGQAPYDDIQVLSYLVHYPDYPTHRSAWIERASRAGIGGSHTGEHSLSNTEWLTFPMTSQELEAKERALRAHESQAGPLGGFFKLFLNHYEYFGRIGPAEVNTLPSEYAARFGRSSS
ncbi:MAG: PIG-L deacetylase family protein [Syntrophobacteraceae bacterium]